MPSKFPRADRVLTEDEERDRDDAPSRTYFWEGSTMETIPGVTRLSSSRLSTTRIREPIPTFEGDFAEGTNPPRPPAGSAKRSTTRDETAPLD